ncbi:Hydroxylysine kinase [Halotydeus destructor]|nr:Hydroxylysine kinase [Halotydeus destructor]
MALRVGEVIKPPFEAKSVPLFVQEHYGLNVSKFKELNSYDDRNYYILVDECENGGIEFNLKVTNYLDSGIPGLLEALNDLMINLSEGGIPLPIPIATKDTEGKSVTMMRKKLGTEKEYAVRLMTFIPGKLFVDVPYTPNLLRTAGEQLAKLGAVLQNYSSTGGVLETRTFIWSLLCIEQVKDFAHAVDDEDRRQLVNEVFDDFLDNVMAKLDTYPSSLIHGDFNEQNILVKENSAGDYDVCGVLDFNDVHKAPQIFDLAMFCAYCMFESKVLDPILAPKYAVQGYERVRSLNEQEKQALPFCVAARMAQSLTLGAYSHKSDPGNEYLLTTAKTGWSLLSNLRKHTSEELIKLWTV